MDNKTIAIIAVIVIVIAAVAAYAVVSGDDDNDSGKDSGEKSTAHAVTLNGVAANDDNVINGTYDIKRNLVLVTKGQPTGNVAAFLSWITSEEGQNVLGQEFVKLSSYTTEIAPSQSGKTSIVMGGSTSLSETAENLAKAYMAKYSFMSVTVQGGGSGVGETSCDSGVFDIGMLSRDMGSKYAGNLVPLMIGQDGVAVIVHVAGVSNLTLEQVAKIFDGTYTNWNQVGGPDKRIQVISREDGSGTRECFDNAMKATVSGWSLMDGCVSCQSTGLVISQVQSTENSIGYISIGQLARL